MGERVVIAGGGLAGLTCAKYLMDAGFEVELVEAAPYFGGRAATFRDADGDWVEHGLHTFLGVYTEFDRLLCEIGHPPDSLLTWAREVRLQDPRHGETIYGVRPLRAPLKSLMRALTEQAHQHPADKLALLPMLDPGLLDLSALERVFDHLTVAQWWRSIEGADEVLERFLSPFCRGIQSLEADELSAFTLLAWVHHVTEGLPRQLLATYRGARQETIFGPLVEHLRRAGARLRSSTPLRAIGYQVGDPGECGRVTGFELPGGERLEADAYVVAMPSWGFRPLVPEALREDPFFKNATTLPVAPAIAVQLFFDRLVCDSGDLTVLAHGHAPVYQDVSRTVYPDARGSRLSVVFSPADAMGDRDDRAIVALALETLGAVSPRIHGAKLLKSVVIRHAEHHIRPVPGAMSRRPTQVTPVPNLFLAGDWTHQDFFGSQEGAVRSGKAAANEILRALSPELRVSMMPEDFSRHGHRMI
jgi:15-cis-phytoene desaturase